MEAGGRRNVPSARPGGMPLRGRTVGGKVHVMTSARLVIQRVCAETGVQPLEMLGVLLEALRQSHAFHAGLSMADPAHAAGVGGEVDALCQMVSAQSPKNLLETLTLAVFAYTLPAAVKEARARYASGTVSAIMLKDIEDREIERLVNMSISTNWRCPRNAASPPPKKATSFRKTHSGPSCS